MYEGIIQDLIDELGKLPGIGPKSAQRIAFHIVQSERVDINHLVEVLRLVKEKLDSVANVLMSQKKKSARSAAIRDVIIQQYV